MWESAHPRSLHTQARGAPPRALSCRPHGAQSQLGRARAMGLVTGPHTHTPRTHSQWIAGPKTGGRAWESARPPMPHTQARGAPSLACLLPPPQRAKPAHKSERCGVGDGSPRPHTPHAQRMRSGPLLHAPRTGCLAWESAHPRTPHTQARGAPARAPLCSPYSAQSQHARARIVGLVTGPHTHTPRTHSQWIADPVRTPRGRAVGRGRAPIPGRPTPRQEAPQPGALMPSQQRAKPARTSARCGVGDRSAHPHTPHPQPVDSGPRPHAPRTGCWAWESAHPGTPHTQARSAPAGRSHAVPTARNASSYERGLWGW